MVCGNKSTDPIPVERLNGDGIISVTELRRRIESDLERNDNILSFSKSDAVFSDLSSVILKNAEDNNGFIRDMLNYITDNESLSPEGLDCAHKILNSMGSSYLRMRNLYEISRRSEKEDLCQIDLTEFTRRFVESVHAALPIECCRNIRLRHGAKKFLPCAAEPTMLTLILLNFVHNALKHSRSADNRIDIIMSRLRRRRRAAVTVIDYGIGIDLEKLRVVMENNITVGADGHMMLKKYYGCGLIACREMADYMGAEIFVYNIADGGAAFTLLAADPDDVKDRIKTRFRDPSADNASDKKLIDSVLKDFQTVPLPNQ